MSKQIKMPREGSASFRIIKALLERLFVAEKRRLDKQVAGLIHRNNEVHGIQAAGFLYQGEYYTAEGFQQVGNARKLTLHTTLQDDMDWHIKDAGIVAEDEQLIGQIIYKLIDPCETLQEMRDSLPDCLAAMIPDVAKLDRHNDEGWSLRQDTRGERQFQKLLPKIEMYSASRLMY